jgi:hypothetical protein
LAAALIGATVLAASTTAQAATGFTTVPSPNPGSNYNEIDGLAAVTAGNAWAVGFQRSSGLLFHVMVQHWNGKAWSVAKSASLPGSDDTRLHAVTALSATSIWAVGSETTSTSTQSLIEHWNGTAWSVVPSPAGEPADSELLGLAAVSATDVWAVGHTTVEVGEGSGTLIEHWNGTAWTVVTSPQLSDTGTGYLTGVAAVGSGDIWAVGRDGRHPTPVIENWNGSAWTTVSQPVSGFDSALNSVTVVSGSDVWAVGEQNLNQTVTEQWNGTSWTLVPSPSVTANGAQDTLSAVTALSSGDIWAVGLSLQNPVSSTLAEHWNGTAWQIVSTTDPDPGSNTLDTVAGTAAGQPLWAAGFGTGGTPATASLIETTTG